jgi:NAD(P)H-hydrate epimerase
VRPVFTAEQMRQLDRRAIAELGIPGATLMENAGRGAADAIAGLLTAPGGRGRGARVVLVCGKGGNGGDGFVAARWLARAGFRCRVLLTGRADEVRGDAGAKLRDLAGARLVPEVIAGPELLRGALAEADLVVDALLGTGAAGGPAGLVAQAIEQINAGRAPVVALDIPSGLPAGGQAPAGPVIRATLTVTFAGLKVGLVSGPGVALAGTVRVVPIGIPEEEVARGIETFLLEREDVAAGLPARPREAHKGTYGHLLVVAGSLGKTGAAALAALAALRSGVGLVTAATPASQQPVVAGLAPEPMTEPLPETPAGTIAGPALEVVHRLAATRDAVALGPGLGLHPETREVARSLAGELPRPMVIDADALSALAGHLELLARAPAPRCLTPHPGEMARMLGMAVADVQQDRIGTVRDAAGRLGVHLVLKGATSVIGLPDGRVILNPTGNPGMASGGTGDVLTGMVGAFLARGFEPGQALQAAVYLHGRAGDLAAARLGEEALVASDVIAALPEAFVELATARPRP